MSKVLKCKICGGDLDAISKDIAVCQYCGSKQILPKMTSDRKANLYDRANHYRINNEFDKAAAVYEQVLAEDDSDAEVYWDLVLCRYGIEYVEDPRTKKRIPTVNRTQFQSIFEDRNYLLAIEHASSEQKEIIKADAEIIDRIQKGILDISNKEQPYDIFICYKETDDSGRRTPDSVLAQDIYKALVEEGYKVFFSRITLEDKLGSAYEPYIFAALNSSKVMIVVGTKPDYFNAVWVKNEWSRYLGLISAGEKKVLIPAYKDMDPYDLPEEFSHLQAQDMGKLGFIQDLVRGVTKIITPVHQTLAASTNVIDVDAYKTRIEVFLENGDFANAKEYCDKVLDIHPKDTETYIYKLCAEMHVKQRSGLSSLEVSFDNNPSFQNAIKFANHSEKIELENYLASAKEKELSKRRKTQKVMKYIAAASAVTVVLVLAIIVIVNGNKLSNALSRAEQLAEDGKFTEAYTTLYDLDAATRKNSKLVDYISAGKDFQDGNYESAKSKLEKLAGYKDSDSMLLNIRYQSLVSKLDELDLATAKQEFENLKELGIEDSDGIENILIKKDFVEQFNIRYDAKQYTSCSSWLERWKTEYPEMAQEFIIDNQENWYKEAMDIVNDEESFYSNMQVKGRYPCKDASDLFSLCDKSYKDAEVYYELIAAFSGYPRRVSAMWNNIDKVPMAKKMLWTLYSTWIEGTTWKTSDGTLYFSIDKGGNSSYNIPWFDTPNTFFDIDYNGIYYVYDKSDTTQPPTTRRDLFRFEIINESQIKVYCYKDKSSYTLYKQ